MPELIETLRENHKRVFEAMKDAKDSCVSTRDGHRKLMASKERLLAHLDLEDTRFYPALREAARNDRGLHNLLAQFDDDLREVSEVAHDFFERYTEGCTDLDFLQDFGTFFMMLKDRMAKEENVLFAEYERLIGKD
jgi:hypothetical protein